MLNADSQGVVHHTTSRTRLRIPADYRDREEMRKLETRLQHVPGVKYCETNEHTGSIVIFHEPQADILDHIGQAIKGIDQHLFELLAEPRPAQPKGKLPFSRLLSKVKETTQERGEEIDVDDAKQLLKKGMPLAFVAAGVMTLLETESLLAGVAPIVLFYYAFDLHWKFDQERRTKTLESDLGHAEI